MKKQWKKDIRDQLKDFQMKAPEGLLDDIKKEMNRRHPVSVPTWNRYLLQAASIAAIIAIWIGVTLPWKDARTIPATEVPTITDTENPVSPSTIPAVDTILTTPTVVPHLIAQVEKDQVMPDKSQTTKDEATQYEEKVSTGKKEPAEEKEESRPQTTTEKESSPTPEPVQWTYTLSRKRTSSYAFSVYYAGVTNPAKQSSDEIAAQPNIPNEDPAETDSTTTSRNVTSPLPSGLDGTAKHHFPIRAGISFRYHLNEQWYLQSGLTYSYLASEISNVSLSVSYKTKQKLHYIGIPLQAGYRIWDNKQFKGYVSIGGQVERLVSGKAHVRYTFANHEHTAVDKNIDDSHLWFSALASIGAEYKLGKSFSLYAEPGIHYYFRNGSRLQTYYNAHPLNFSITLGLRFHWKK